MVFHFPLCVHLNRTNKSLLFKHSFSEHPIILLLATIKYNQHKYGGPEYEGPYAITTINDNGTARFQWRKFYDVVNIRNIKPYYQ